MAAQDNMNPQQFKGKYLYHESHISNRNSIQQSGLEARVPQDSQKDPKGVYMSQGNNSEYGSSMNSAQHFGYDRWRVNVEGLPVSKDPDPGHSTAWHSPADIDPSRIKLAKKGSPDWEKNI